jgi:hypothetical protein
MSDQGSGSEEELSTISYRAVSVGLPVVTHSGDQFGVVEHVLDDYVRQSWDLAHIS